MKNLTERMRGYFYERHDYLGRLFHDNGLDDTYIADAVTTIESGRTVTINGKRCTLFGLADYNGFDIHPAIKEAAIEAINKFGMHVGTSRVYLDLDSYRELEKKLARFLGAEDSLVFGTVSLANIGLISSLADENTVFFTDVLAHHSMAEGLLIARAKKAEVITVPHNRPDKLEQKLKTHRHKFKFAFYLTDGVFSMSGDYPDLKEFQRVTEKYDTVLYVDDSHGFGVMGEGKGLVGAFNLKWDNLMYVSSLSKGLSSVGGFVAGNKDILSYFRKAAPTMIFSGPIPIPNVYTAIKALDIIQTEEGKKIRKRLWDNIALANQLILDAGYQTNGGVSPIVILQIPDLPTLIRCGLYLFENGMYSNLVTYPAVPRKDNFIRISINSVHAEIEIKKLAGLLKEFGENGYNCGEYKIIA